MVEKKSKRPVKKEVKWLRETIKAELMFMIMGFGLGFMMAQPILKYFHFEWFFLIGYVITIIAFIVITRIDVVKKHYEDLDAWAEYWEELYKYWGKTK